MAKVKTKKEIEILREAGKNLALLFSEMEKMVKPGITAKEIEDFAQRRIKEMGDEPALLGYTPWGAERPYPAVLCVELNDEVVHGIPTEKEYLLKEGDIFGIDTVIKHKGMYVDMAKTWPVGKVDKAAQKLIDTTKESLERAIAVCHEGADIHDIGRTIEAYAKPLGYGIVEDLGGHGVGHKVHEPPYIENYAIKEKGVILKEGMVLAIEPMLNEGTHEVVLDSDGYTYRTKDGKRSAHFEHSVLVTKGDPEILTKI